MKKKKYRIKDKFLDTYKETKRSSLLVFLILRVLVIICMISQILNGNIENAVLCLISLGLLIAPSILQHKLDITLPNTLETIIYLFIFSAEILGEINNFYGRIPYWDTALHIINGFLCSAIGFSLINLLNKSSENIKLSPLYLCVVAFCFSMTIGVLWEFMEFSFDKYLIRDMQKDRIITTFSSTMLNPKNENVAIPVRGIDKTVLYDKDDNVLAVIDGGYLDIGITDTIEDLFGNFIGALVFSCFGYIYLVSNKNEKLISNFVPTKGKRKMTKSIESKLTTQKRS